MPRPKSPVPKVPCHIVLSQELYSEIRLLLHDSNYLHGFSKGAFSDLVEKALKAYLKGLNNE